MERAEEVFDRITDRITALQTEKAADLRVHLFGPATTPVEPVTTQTKFVAIAAVAMFTLPFAAGFTLGSARCVGLPQSTSCGKNRDSPSSARLLPCPLDR